MKKTIAEHMIDIMIENEVEAVGYGDLSLLGECAKRSEMNLKNNHPLNRNKAVLDALETSIRFQKSMFLCITNRGERLVRNFKLLTLDEVVKKIEDWQDGNVMHPMTCGKNSEHILRPLVIEDRVVLSCPHCEYVQKRIPKVIIDVNPEIWEDLYEER